MPYKIYAVLFFFYGKIIYFYNLYTQIMMKVELFIREKNIKISDIEDALGLNKKSLKLTSRGIPKKHIKGVIGYLVENYGYKDEMSECEADIPVGNPEWEIIAKRVWNNGFIPKWEDGIIRYRDSDSGLWKRLWDWQSYREKDKGGNFTGKRKIRDEFLPSTGEILRDKIGDYYIAKNGIKVYSFRGNLGDIS